MKSLIICNCVRAPQQTVTSCFFSRQHCKGMRVRRQSIENPWESDITYRNPRKSNPTLIHLKTHILYQLSILLPIGSARGLVAIPLCNNNQGSALGPAATPLWNNNKEYQGALAQTTGPCNNLWRRGSLYTQASPRQWPRCVGLIEGNESQ